MNTAHHHISWIDGEPFCISVRAELQQFTYVHLLLWNNGKGPHVILYVCSVAVLSSWPTLSFICHQGLEVPRDLGVMAHAPLPLPFINSVQTRCIMKTGRPRKAHFSGEHLGGFYSQDILFLLQDWIPAWDRLNWMEWQILCTPCRATCFYNALVCTL